LSNFAPNNLVYMAVYMAMSLKRSEKEGQILIYDQMPTIP